MMDDYICETLRESERTKLENHIKTCPGCARTFAEIKDTYSFIGSGGDEVPTPDWDTSWRIIRKQVMEKTTAQKSPSFGFNRGYKWGLSAVAALIIFLVGIFVGKFLTVTPGESTTGKEDITYKLQAALKEHIENIKPVILQYANYNRAAEIQESIPIDREIAAKFLTKNRLLQGQLGDEKNKYLLQLLEELDMILTEISNLTTDEPENLLLIKELIKMKGTLLKIELIHAPKDTDKRMKV
jgi:hypothetical protein